MSVCYVWRPRTYFPVSRNDVTECGAYGAMAFEYEGERWIFVEPREGHTLGRSVPNSMQTSGPVFDYGRALWELSK